MNGVELSHLLFRWLHALSAVMAVGQVWSLTFVYRLRPGLPVDPGVGAVVSLVLVTGLAAGLHRVMTGRAMFIHIGAMLGVIVANNVQQRIWPIESRRLGATSSAAPPSAALVEVAALRLRHNASLSVAVILFMVSNHFPLLYGQSLSWTFPPAIVVIGWLATRGF